MIWRRRNRNDANPDPAETAALVAELVDVAADDSGERALEIAESLLRIPPQPSDEAMLIETFESPKITFFSRELLAGPLAHSAGPAALPTLLTAISRNIAEGFDADGIEPHVDGIVAEAPEASARYLRELLSSPDATVREVASELLDLYLG